MEERFVEIDPSMYEDAQPNSVGQRAAGGAEKGFQYGSALGPLGSVVGAGAGALYGALNPQSQLKPSNVAKSAAQIGTEVVKAPFYASEIPARVAGYVTGRKPKDKFISEQIQDVKNKYLGEYQPENIIDKGLHYTAANWPFLFIGGTPTLGKVGTDIVGSTGMAIAEKVSDNPLIMILGDALARHGLDKGVQALGRVVSGETKAATKAYPKVEAHKAAMYKKSEDLGSRLSAKPLVNDLKATLNDIKQNVSDDKVTNLFDKAAKKRTLTHINELEDVLLRQNLSLSDLAREEKIFNKHWSPNNTIENRYFNQIKNSITDSLESLKGSANKPYKEFAKYYENAKGLHATSKWQSNLGKWAENQSERGILEKILTHKMARLLLGGIIGKYSNPITGLAAYVGVPAGKKALEVGAKGTQEAQRLAKFAKHLMGTKEGVNLLKDIVVESANNNTSALTKSLRNLNKQAEVFDEFDNEERFVEINPADYVDAY